MIDFVIDNEVKQAFEQEFTCYYHADLLPVNWTETAYLDESAKSSINRLSIKLDRNLLSRILSTLIQNREHELNSLTSDACGFEWTLEDDEWDKYLLLLQTMLKYI